jgi:hypothetical protein
MEIASQSLGNNRQISGQKRSGRSRITNGSNLERWIRMLQAVAKAMEAERIKGHRT